MLAQPPVGHDIGLAGVRGIEPVLVQAAQPAADHVRVALRGAAQADLFDLADMGEVLGTRHVVSMERPICVE